jgi:hypothetical protein
MIAALGSFVLNAGLSFEAAKDAGHPVLEILYALLAEFVGPSQKRRDGPKGRPDRTVSHGFRSILWKAFGPQWEDAAMSLRSDAKQWVIREQVFEDPASGLTFQFEIMPDGEPRFRVFGEAMPFGNREYFFNGDGVKNGSGTATAGLCRPAWMTEIDA